jgi:hypothetical protein
VSRWARKLNREALAEARRALEAERRAGVEVAYSEAKRIMGAPYDGILGDLEEWARVGDWHGRFLDCRGRLLAQYGHAQALAFLDAHAEQDAFLSEVRAAAERGAPPPPPRSVTPIPADVRDCVAHLFLLRAAVLAGPDRGLAILGGRDLAAGFKSRQAASKPRGEPWYAPFLREYVADVLREFGERKPTLSEWADAARARGDSEFWTRQGVEVYLPEGEDGEPVVVVSKSGEHGEAAATKAVKLKALYRYFPR